MLLSSEPQAELCAAAIEPILNDPLPDPYVYRDNTDWYVFGTGTYFFQGKSLTSSGMRRRELNLDFGARNRRPCDIWGFTPHLHPDEGYHAYCTLHYGKFRTVVAHFVPADGEKWSDGYPITNWVFDKTLVGNLPSGETTYYESKFMVDEDGQQYLIYCASGGKHQDVHIMAQRMRGPGEIDSAYPPHAILSPEGFRSEDRNPGYIQIVEGANIVRIQEKYVLLYSVGDFGANNYKLGVAYSDVLIPRPGVTYEKVVVPDWRDVWKNGSGRGEVEYLLQSEEKYWPNYCGDLLSGPGLGNIIKSGGLHHLVFHGYLRGDRRRCPSKRYVWTLPLTIQISPELPQSEWIRPELPGARKIDPAVELQVLSN